LGDILGYILGDLFFAQAHPVALLSKQLFAQIYISHFDCGSNT
jgi:hypothetical protein